MTNKLSQSGVKALGLGAVAGMRSMSAPAVLSHFLSKPVQQPLHTPPFTYLQHSTVATVFKVLAVAELITDKLPHVPDRIIPASLVVRTISGAVVGMACSEESGMAKVKGALLGGLGAIAASYVFFYLRRKLVKTTGLPDVSIALLEDALAISVGTACMKV